MSWPGRGGGVTGAILDRELHRDGDEAKSPGLFLADLVALIARFDVVAPEIDR
ncbi:hypothetical protein WME73_49680 [Sorangium sp. So ce302]|uniref:hypothetical protein n=1 Tax=Sorangium sp. So ce302 TaxID=3133297 RepID=UPI003F63B5A5